MRRGLLNLHSFSLKIKLEWEGSHYPIIPLCRNSMVVGPAIPSVRSVRLPDRRRNKRRSKKPSLHSIHLKPIKFFPRFQSSGLAIERNMILKRSRQRRVTVRDTYIWKFQLNPPGIASNFTWGNSLKVDCKLTEIYTLNGEATCIFTKPVRLKLEVLRK